ncbi:MULTISPECIES: chitinase [unclassified Streptomyces]|uniref:chitinase n=1 Tax=unclassified Streptomyces TaxID=2593676 RepID=UPI002E19A337
MPLPLKSAAGMLGLAVLACAGCATSSDTGSDTGSDTRPDSSAATGYAPYVSASTAYAPDSAGSPDAYNLAFVVSNGSSCTPSWGGHTKIADAGVASRLKKLADSGATLRVSFGGADGNELATTCDSASDLAAAYAKALDAAGDATHVDFDIEGDTLKDSAANTKRAKAIALLQKQRDVDVTFTLPVMPSGLDDDSVDLLEAANNQSVQVSTVNVMTMNYGESYQGDMSDYAGTSARATHAQLKKVFGLSDAKAWRGMALTSMLGANDIDGETFTLADAAQLRSFAEKKGIAWVSTWATFRDVQCESGTGTDDAATNCSGVKQSEGAYGRALAG